MRMHSGRKLIAAAGSLVLISGLVAAVSLVTAPQARAAPHKVMVIVDENHSRTDAMANMPHLAGWASQFGQATGYNAITHPSLPNYFAIWGGSTFGVTSDCSVGSSGCVPTPPSVWGQTLTAGGTAKAYQEDMTSNCQTGGSGNYAPRHGPWPYWTDSAERAGCNANDVPMGTTTSGNLLSDINNGSLPVTGEMTPNLCNDAHDCSLGTADTWLNGWVPKLMAGPDYTAGNLTIIVTFDEGSSSDNNVAFVVIDPRLSGTTVTGSFNHYALTRWLDDNAGVSPLRNAATAGDLRGAFGLGGGGQCAPSGITFSPSSGPAGTAVTLTGTCFTGATAMKFNGTTASFTVASDTSITTTVPAGATTGPVSVTGPGGTGTSTASFTVTVTGACPVTGTTTQEQNLAAAICNVPADAQYGLHDSGGNSMDGMKVISTSGGTPAYVAVYQNCTLNPCQVVLGGSADLRAWTFERVLSTSGSAPTVKRLTDGSYLMAYESSSGSHHLAYKWYPDLAHLLVANDTANFDAPDNLGTCQGTPNIYSPVTYTNGTLTGSVFTIGFHWSNCGTDQQGTGHLSDFNAWCGTSSSFLNTALAAAGAAGKIGDRDAIWHGGQLYDVVEGNTVASPYSAVNWRLYAYGFTEGAAVQLPVHTAGGSVAFENPTVTALVGPDGTAKLVISLFIPAQGTGEAGELLYTVPDALGTSQGALPSVLQNPC